MKPSFLIIVSMILSISVSGQNLVYSKFFSSLKNLKYASSNAAKNEYAVILNDNSMLSVKYRLVESTEYNASYIFILTPSGYEFRRDKSSNYKYLLDNIDKWTSVLGFKADVQKLIKNKIEESKENISNESFFLLLDFLEGYDEANFTFNNNINSLTCEFFFRRLL